MGEDTKLYVAAIWDEPVQEGFNSRFDPLIKERAAPAGK
jgi:hypothetical protein